MPPLRCPFCFYEWEYKGDKRLATCPSCFKKISVSQNTIDKVHDAIERKILQYIIEHDRELATELIDKHIVSVLYDTDISVEVHIVAKDSENKKHKYVTKIPVSVFL